MNLVVIQIIGNMKIESLNSEVFFNGDFYDFNKKWFFEIGAGLCVTQLIYAVKMHIGNFKAMGKVVAMRFLDRGFKVHIKKQTEKTASAK